MVTRRLPAAARKRQIAEAALKLLGSRGVRGLKATTLARAIGTTDATLFRHFAGMKDIVNAALELFEAELMATVPAASDDDPLVQLRAFFTDRLERWRSRPELLRLVTSDRLIDVAGPSGARRIRTLRERSEAFVSRCLRKAQEAGRIGNDLPVEVLTWMVQGAAQGASRRTAVARAARGRRRQTGPEPAAVWAAVEAVLLRSAKG